MIIIFLYIFGASAGFVWWRARKSSSSASTTPYGALQVGTDDDFGSAHTSAFLPSVIRDGGGSDGEFDASVAPSAQYARM
jgi:hypothetical protein